ncbi:hypothetical protein [Methanopyrus kandleri]|uniref:Uncharacterized protein n=1 Tax=Methanopyrus kandleri TaxID=2320 RepID=A0A832SSY0_9EURY|nr:hypothetical protein [Methanopyrus kandleri]HII69747.1 hypothetical protein [Methanopyrus kandleri]
MSSSISELPLRPVSRDVPEIRCRWMSTNAFRIRPPGTRVNRRERVRKPGGYDPDPPTPGIR